MAPSQPPHGEPVSESIITIFDTIEGIVGEQHKVEARIRRHNLIMLHKHVSAQASIYNHLLHEPILESTYESITINAIRLFPSKQKIRYPNLKRNEYHTKSSIVASPPP